MMLKWKKLMKKFISWGHIIVLFSSVGLIIGTILPWDVFIANYNKEEYPWMFIFHRPGFFVSDGSLVELIGLLLLCLYILYHGKSDQLLSMMAFMGMLFAGAVTIHHYISLPKSPSTSYPIYIIAFTYGGWITLISVILGIIGSVSLYYRGARTSSLIAKKRIVFLASLIVVFIAINPIIRFAWYFMIYQGGGGNRSHAVVLKTELPISPTPKEIARTLVEQSDTVLFSFPLIFNQNTSIDCIAPNCECFITDLGEYGIRDYGYFYSMDGISLC